MRESSLNKIIKRFDFHVIALILIVFPLAMLIGRVHGAIGWFWIVVEMFVFAQAFLIKRGFFYLVVNSVLVLFFAGGSWLLCGAIPFWALK